MKKILGVLLMLSMAIGGTVIATNTTKDVQAQQQYSLIAGMKE